MLTRRLLLRAMLVAVLSPLARILPAVPTARRVWDEDLYQQCLDLQTKMWIDLWDKWESHCWSTPTGFEPPGHEKAAGSATGGHLHEESNRRTLPNAVPLASPPLLIRRPPL